MIDVDSKISKYLETKRVTISLRKEVEQLQTLMRNLEDLIKEENKQVKDLENEVIASIKVENLLDKISKLEDPNEIIRNYFKKFDDNNKITVLNMFIEKKNENQ